MSCGYRSIVPRVPPRWRSSGGVASLLWKRVSPARHAARKARKRGCCHCSRPRVSTPCKLPAYFHSASPDFLTSDIPAAISRGSCRERSFWLWVIGLRLAVGCIKARRSAGPRGC